MKYRWLPAWSVFAFTLSGCATVYEGKYSFGDGWREAKVVQPGSASDIAKPQFSDCRNALSPQQLASEKFIMLSYEHMDHQRTRVVPLNRSEGVRPGDLVYMNVAKCDIPLVPRGKPK